VVSSGPVRGCEAGWQSASPGVRERHCRCIIVFAAAAISTHPRNTLRNITGAKATAKPPSRAPMIELALIACVEADAVH